VLADVESYDTPDPSTFVVRLSKPNAVFVDILKSPVYPFAIIPAEQKEKAGREVDIVGTGPSRWRVGQGQPSRAEALRQLCGGRQRPRTGRPRRAPDCLSRQRALQFRARSQYARGRPAVGRRRLISDVPPDLAKRFEGRADLTALKVFPFCMQVFVVNTQQGPTKDPLVRQAIEAVVGADDVLDAMGTLSQKSHSLVYANSPYYQGDAMKPYYGPEQSGQGQGVARQGRLQGREDRPADEFQLRQHAQRDPGAAEQMKAAGMNAAVDVSTGRPMPATCSAAPAPGMCRPPAIAPIRCSDRSSGR